MKLSAPSLDTVRASARLACGLVLTHAWLAACGHDDGPAVPFKLDDDTVQPAERPSDQGAAPTPQTAALDQTQAARVGVSLPAETTEVQVGNHRVAIAGETIRARLDMDLDQDEQLDALLVSVSAQGAINLQRAMLGANNAEPIAHLHTLEPGCQVQVVALTRHSAAHVSASAELECPTGSPHSDKEPPPAQGVRTREIWILDTLATPRVMERVRLLPRADDAPLDDVSLSLRDEDLDADGNLDVVGTLKLGEATAPRTLELRWLNRASGLDRDRQEPEATMAELAKRAKAARDAAERTQLAEEALRWFDALCRESAQARLTFAGVRGLPCGPSAGAGLAWSLLARERANHGDVVAAVEAYARLSDAALRVVAADREAVLSALNERAQRQPWQWTPIGDVDPVPGPAARLPRVAWLDEHRLLLRGASPRVYDVRTGETEPSALPPSDSVLRDGSGGHAVVAIQRHCDGLHLAIASTSQIVNGHVLGANVSEPRIDPMLAPEPCSGSRKELRLDEDGGFRVLGWMSKGVLVARLGALRFVPIADGQPAGEVSALDDGFPMPAPLEPGLLAPDGSALITTHEVGFVVQSTAEPRGRLIAKPGPFDPNDVAVAPGALRAAYVFGDRVFVGAPAGQAPPQPAAHE